MSERAATRVAFVLGASVILGWFGLLALLRPELVADEQIHFRAAAEVAHGRWPAAGWLPMFPGFHAVLAGVLRVGGESLTMARGACTVLAIVALALWSRAAFVATPGLAPAKTLLFAVNPLWLPFATLVYTETPSVLSVGAAALCCLRGFHIPAAALLAVGALVRQTNLFWALLFVAWVVPKKPGVAGRLRGAWPYVVVLLGAVGFALLNPAAAMRPNAANQLKLNPAQLYLYLFIIALAFLPLWISTLRQNWAERYQPALARGWIAAGVFAAVGVAILGFDNPHPWNGDPNYLRNRLLIALQTEFWVRASVSVAMVGMLVAWAGFVTTQRSPALTAWTWGLGLLFVELHWLAEPRYAILPVMLAILALQCEKRVAWGLVGWNVVLAGAMCGYVLVNGSVHGGVP